MAKQTSVSLHYDSEKDFKRDYLKIKDKRQQLVKIREYREWLARLDESKAALIRAIAENLYSERTQRFFLELLQNSDDNQYQPGTEPTVEFEYLGGDILTIRNNETGFSAEDVYSITTAALSTKYLSDNSAYIGEKGIGFKSVFAVADRVDIHSNGYHFSLFNGEYIIPHWIEEEYHQSRQTEIVLHLKRDTALRNKIADNLRELSEQTLGMILFLHKIKYIIIKDSDDNIDRIRLVDTGHYRELYFNNRQTARYFLFRYAETVEATEIKHRYPRLFQDQAIRTLNREIIFAVPDSTQMDLSRFKGSYFAFLQTRMETGLKMHIQIDAETTTNREQYTLMADSPWNAKMLAKLEQQIYKLFLMLRNEPNFRNRLPEYFPTLSDAAVNGNDDARDLQRRIRAGLPQQPIFMNRAGDFKKSDEVVLISTPESDIFYQESKYEKLIKDILPEERKYKPGSMFIDQTWNHKYFNILAAYGVYKTDTVDPFILLRAGPPKTVKLSDYASVMQFNQKLITMLKSVYDYQKLSEDTQVLLQSAKVFPASVPVKSGFHRDWVSATGSKELRWQDVASKSARGPSRKYVYIDAEFTYRPGGKAKNRDMVTQLNSGYRDFLSYVGVKQHSVLNSLIDDHVRPLLQTKSMDPAVAERHWIAIYNDYWLKQSLLERERGEIIHEFLAHLPSCQVPVLVADLHATCTTCKVSDSFLGDSYHADETELYREYMGSDAPVIHFSGFSPKSKVKWASWREFFSDNCKAHTGPYLVTKELKADNEINTSITSFSTQETDLAALNPFFREIALAVKRQPQFREEYASFSINYSVGGKHFVLDRYSHCILRSNPDSDYLARSIAQHLWQERGSEIQVNVGWKYKSSCTITVRNCYFESYIIPFLPLRDTSGKLVRHGERAFISSRANRDIMGSLGVYIKDTDYAGNILFLDAWGLKHEVDAHDVLACHDACAKNMLLGRSTFELYLLHLRMVCTYQKGIASDKEIVQKSLQIWNPELSAVQPPHLWIHGAKKNGFPEDIVSDVRKLFVERDNLSVEELLDNLFLGVHGLDSSLYRIISDLGLKSIQSIDDMAADLDDRFNDSGITLLNRKIHSRDKLPVVWLLNLGFRKEDADDVGVWVIAPDSATDAFIKGLNILGWPSSNDFTKSAESESMRALTSLDQRKLYMMYCESEADENQDGRLENETKKEIIQRIMSNAIVICQGLYFGVNGTMLQIQYALYDKLYLNESIIPLFSLMYGLGGGMTPMAMKKYWDTVELDEEEHAESTRGTDQREDKSSAKDHQSSEKKSGTSASSSQDGTGWSGSASGNSEGAKSGDGNRTRSSESKPYAFYRTGIYATKPSGIPDDNKRETGKKGEQLVTDSEIKEGRIVEIQPENNPGFDLISRDEGETRYIEVKTVNGVWSHVLLTKREYEAAQQYLDQYWIYVVELLNDDKHKLTRIQNPFAKVTHYSLDNGWKVVENPGWYSHSDEYDDLYT